MAKVSLVFVLVQLAAAYEPAPEWRTDSQTGKQYTVITTRRVMDYETSSALCGVVLGKLAEPRDQHENQFIFQLIGDRKIYLGMKDSQLNGQWMWQSDRTNVSWANWQTWNGTILSHAPEPNGQDFNESCAMIASESYGSQGIPYNRSTWIDVRCNVSVRRVVCEKQTSCIYKVYQCMTDNGVRSSIAPNVTHMCAVKDEIERCIEGVVCSNSHQQQISAGYYRRNIQELCSITTVNWTVWETSTTTTCMNDNDLEVDTMKQLNKCLFSCQGNVCDVCSILNARYACFVNEMSDVCADEPYIDYVKEFNRASIRALIGTIQRRFTQPPYNCTLTFP